MTEEKKTAGAGLADKNSVQEAQLKAMQGKGGKATNGFHTGYDPDLKGKIEAHDVGLHYGDFEALKQINLAFPEKQITALIGPSGCGKSSLLKCLNRMNDLVPGAKVTGSLTIDGLDMYDPKVDLTSLRKRIGMVFQQPNPFPMSLYDNVAYGPRLHGTTNKRELDEIVERSLRGAALWDEVKDRLKRSALGISGGQAQRLCIARALAVTGVPGHFIDGQGLHDPVTVHKKMSANVVAVLGLDAGQPMGMGPGIRRRRRIARIVVGDAPDGPEGNAGADMGIGIGGDNGPFKGDAGNAVIGNDAVLVMEHNHHPFIGVKLRDREKATKKAGQMPRKGRPISLRRRTSLPRLA